jgi:ribosomal protein L40E
MDDERRQKRLEDALDDGRIICERCGATLATYADACTAENRHLCPGDLAMDKTEFGN